MQMHELCDHKGNRLSERPSGRAGVGCPTGAAAQAPIGFETSFSGFASLLLQVGRKVGGGSEVHLVGRVAAECGVRDDGVVLLARVARLRSS
jgi:hypothetical protein